MNAPLALDDIVLAELRRNAIDTLEQALMADGVAPDKLYPLDLDRAFKSLDRIKKHVAVWWTSGAQAMQHRVSLRQDVDERIPA